MGTIHGKKGKFKVGTTVIAETRSWSVSITKNKDDDMSFGDDWRTQLLGTREWSITAEVNFDPASSTLIDAVLGETLVAVELYPDAGGAGMFGGNVWLEGEWNVSKDSTSQASVSGDGDGPPTWTPPV